MKQELYILMKDSSWAMWAGIAIPFLFDKGVLDWKFWLFVIPLIFLVGWMKS